MKERERGDGDSITTVPAFVFTGHPSSKPTMTLGFGKEPHRHRSPPTSVTDPPNVRLLDNSMAQLLGG